jgi:hypothetical protein
MELGRRGREELPLFVKKKTKLFSVLFSKMLNIFFSDGSGSQDLASALPLSLSYIRVLRTLS